MSSEIDTLKDSLVEFATSNDRMRENLIPGLVRFIRKFGNDQEIGAELVAHMESPWHDPQHLAEAIRCAALTPFYVKDSQRVLPWTGGFTVVALSSKGEFMGHRKVEGRVYREIGDNLYPYALTKAMLRMHLDFSGREGGLDNEQNFYYFEDLGLHRGDDLFLGESQLGNRDNRSYIGVSGCELAWKYVQELIPSDMHAYTTVDYIAGHADMIFARNVAGYLMIPGEPAPIKEPPFFTQLRMAH